MTTLQGLFLAIGWVLLRFGLPVLVTVILYQVFKYIDQRWQAQAGEFRRKTGLNSLTPAMRCWALKKCPLEQREKCAAYRQKEVPCWQVFRSTDGQLKEACLECEVFRGVPIPALGD